MGSKSHARIRVGVDLILVFRYMFLESGLGDQETHNEVILIVSRKHFMNSSNKIKHLSL